MEDKLTVKHQEVSISSQNFDFDAVPEVIRNSVSFPVGWPCEVENSPPLGGGTATRISCALAELGHPIEEYGGRNRSVGRGEGGLRIPGLPNRRFNGE